MEKNWRKSSRPFLAKTTKNPTSAKPGVIEGFEKWGDIELFDLKPILEHMQAKAKQILVTTESHEVIILRRRALPVSGFCPMCGGGLTVPGVDPSSQIQSMDEQERDVRALTEPDD